MPLADNECNGEVTTAIVFCPSVWSLREGHRTIVYRRIICGHMETGQEEHNSFFKELCSARGDVFGVALVVDVAA